MDFVNLLGLQKGNFEHISQSLAGHLQSYETLLYLSPLASL